MTTTSRGSEVGSELPPISVNFTEEMCISYSGWPETRDFHTDLQLAKEKGFPSVIIEASVTMAYINELLTRFFGTNWFTSGYLRLSFINIVYPPERLTVKGVVREKMQEDSGVRLTVEAWVENEKGDRVTVATASALI